MIAVKIPGKIILAGEYGILCGLRGIVLAVDRYAMGRFTPDMNTSFRFKTWGDYVEKNNHPLIMAAKAALHQKGFKLPTGHYVIDTSDFYVNQRKLGFGSSAAAAVALATLALQAQDITNKEIIFELSSSMHNMFQREPGSGIDIAASVYGGAFVYRNAPTIEKIDLSSIWKNIILIDTGISQSTRDFVGRFKEAQLEKKYLIDLLLSSMEESLLLLFAPQNGGENDEESKSEEKIVTTFTRLNDGLRQLGQMCSIDIVSPVHERIINAALSVGGNAKPSGAGGGDIAIAYIPPKHREAFLDLCQKNHWSVITAAVAL